MTKSNEIEIAPDTVRFAGLVFRAPNTRAIELADDLPKFIVTVNADFIVRAHEDFFFKNLLETNLSTFDGQIPFFLAKVFNFSKRSHISKLSGSDLIYHYLERAAAEGKCSFLFGSSPQANSKAILNASKKYKGCVKGYSPPLAEYPPSEEWNNAALDRIRDARPSYLFVALGSPKQELWIDANLPEIRNAGVEVVIGCGGSIDFLAGTHKRAPVWIQRAGFEGVYRLIKEPKAFRLARLLRSFKIFRYIFR